MNFPANPTLNQTYTYGTRTWKWDGTTWNLQRGATALATVATTGSFTDLVNKPTTIAGYGIVDATAAIPKITSIVVTDSSYTALDDTAVSTAGGYIKIIGTGFTTGSQVLINTTSASSVSFVNSTELRAQLPATAAGTYVVYVVATDGSVAIRVNGITFSATPTWTTGSTLPESLASNAISIQFAATSNSNITYSLASGSTLPSGLNLSSNGLLSGTVTGVTVDTTYNFTINAIDQELQDSPRAFSISISVVQQIARSLRFNKPDTTYLNRTPSSAGNRRTYTWSGWVKRTEFSNDQVLFFAGTGGDNDTIRFNTDNTFYMFRYNNGFSWQLSTTQVFRDPSAWYHIVFVYDSTQATSSNRIKLYVNGTQVTVFGTAAYPTLNFDSNVDNTVEHRIGNNSATNEFNGYMTEINFVDGQALTPTNFGGADPNTGVWRPVRYTGTYGTNGFYLNFSDNSATTATTLGKDYSGNGNNFTPNNFSVAAGVDNDSLVDSPTSYGVDTGVGGEVRGNYATLNPLAFNSSPGGTGQSTFSNGNLQAVNSAVSWTNCFSTISMNSGKFYFEFVILSGTADAMVGIYNVNTPIGAMSDYIGHNSSGYIYYTSGNKATGGSFPSYGASWTTGDVIGTALDLDAGTLVFYKNGVSQGTAFTGLSGNFVFAVTTYYLNSVKSVNFGQRPFAYTAPSGFKALCSQNLPTPAIGATSTTQASKYFNAVTYTGNGYPTSNTQSVTGIGFQPDFTWIKIRSGVGRNTLTDSVRGVNSQLFSDNSAAQETNTDCVTAFNSNGFSLGTNTTGGTNSNVNNATYVAWNWNAGGTTVTNTAGSLTSEVRANTTSGFSIVTYTGNPAAEKTVGHGLGAVPKMIILKARNASTNWLVYHESLGRDTYLMLNTTNVAAGTISNYWGSSGPNSTTFGLIGGGYGNNSSSNYVAYCFAEVPGYSRIGSWAGNGNADGPFVYCGFRPAFVMLKVATGSIDSQWGIFDLQRSPINVVQNELYPAISNAEVSGYPRFDILSNGFKIKTSDTMFNNNGSSYIFIAFAETPFKYARAR